MAPRAKQADADEADRRLPSRHHILLRAEPRRPHDLVAGMPTWAASFRAVGVLTPAVRRMTQSGWATLTRSQVAFWSSPGGCTGRCDPKAVVGGLVVEEGDGFPAIVRVVVDMSDFPALELVHAPGPLTDEPDFGRVLTPVAGRGVEDIGETPAHRRRPRAHSPA